MFYICHDTSERLWRPIRLRFYNRECELHLCKDTDLRVDGDAILRAEGIFDPLVDIGHTDMAEEIMRILIATLRRRIG